MEISKHFALDKVHDGELYRYIKEHNIPVDEDDFTTCVGVDVYESSIHWPIIYKTLREKNIGPILSETVFSKQELNEAEWLRVRSTWRTGHPQPEYHYEEIVYSLANRCDSCGAGAVQKEPFRIKKTPNWGRRHFCELNWVDEELFISGMAKNILRDANITGIEFGDVKNSKGTETLDNIYQIKILTTLQPGLVEDNAYARTVLHCYKCGRKKFFPNGCGKMAFRKEIFQGAPDVVKTGDTFGYERFSAQHILVRQNVYQTIIRNKLDRGLAFYALELV